MAIEVFNRYEKKYLLNMNQFEKVLSVITKYMVLDSYNETTPYYTISNLYCDTEDDFLIRNSLQKPVYKEKLRIRAYGVPGIDDKVFFEIKKKYKGIVNKRRTRMVLRDVYNMFYGIEPQAQDYMNVQVLKEIQYFIKKYSAVPKLYLAYDRRAYFGKDDTGLRISFDTGIRTRRCDLGLELGDYGDKLISDEQRLMEIKAENSIPLWLSKMLSEFEIFPTSFSKYGTEYINFVIKNNGGEEPCRAFYPISHSSLTDYPYRGF